MKNINLVKKDEHNNKSDEFRSIKETIIITDNNKTKNINNNNPIILNKVSNILKMMNKKRVHFCKNYLLENVFLEEKH